MAVELKKINVKPEYFKISTCEACRGLVKGRMGVFLTYFS
jgi:hypothetical protein